MIVPESLVSLLKPWNEFYSHSKAAATIVIFFHIGGLLLAGGLAISADRGTLRALRFAATERPQFMRELGAVHRWVITGLTVVVVSGVLLLTADIETFFGSWIYWTKMALVVVLLINGWMMTRTEASLRQDASETSPHWRSLHRASVRSLALWFVITALGVALANFS
jgi:uncharacterized membrane protein